MDWRRTVGQQRLGGMMKDDPDQNPDQRVVRFGWPPLDRSWSPVTKNLTITKPHGHGDQT